jgi:hypothetical protein
MLWLRNWGGGLRVFSDLLEVLGRGLTKICVDGFLTKMRAKGAL